MFRPLQHAPPSDSALKVCADTLDGVALRLVEEVRGTLRYAVVGMTEAAVRDLRRRT